MINISVTMRDRGLVATEPPTGNHILWVQWSHVSDYVTWPQTVTI